MVIYRHTGIVLIYRQIEVFFGPTDDRRDVDHTDRNCLPTDGSFAPVDRLQPVAYRPIVVDIYRPIAVDLPIRRT